MLASHYAPRTRLLLCGADEAAAVVATLTSSGARVGVLSLGGIGDREAHVAWDAGGDVTVLARSLYRWLRQADAESLDVLVAVPPPPEGLGVAIRDPPGEGGPPLTACRTVSRSPAAGRSRSVTTASESMAANQSRLRRWTSPLGS